MSQVTLERQASPFLEQQPNTDVREGALRSVAAVIVGIVPYIIAQLGELGFVVIEFTDKCISEIINPDDPGILKSIYLLSTLIPKVVNSVLKIVGTIGFSRTQQWVWGRPLTVPPLDTNHFAYLEWIGQESFKSAFVTLANNCVETIEDVFECCRVSDEDHAETTVDVL